MKKGMKQTEIGPIPADWTLVALGDISERVKAKNDGGEYEILTISAKIGFVRQADKYSRYMAGKSVENYTLLKRGEFAYNKGNSLTYPFGCIYRLDDHEEALVPNVYISLKLHNGADSEFFKHLFLQGDFIGRLEKYITSGVRGNGLLNVNAQDFFSLKLALPPLPEQQKIAEILSTVDEQIANIDEQLAQTQELKKGLMQRLLTKGIGHMAFKDSPLGRVPEGWSVSLGEEIASLITKGASPGWQGFDYSASGLLFVTSENVKDGWLDLSSPKFLPVEFNRVVAKSELKAGDLLLNIVGASIGRVCLYQSSYPVANVNQAVCVFRANECTLPKFLLYTFQSPDTLKRLLGTQAGSARQNLSLSDIRSFNILLPPLSEQHQIAEVLSTVDDKLGVLAEKKTHYQTLKKGLMQQLLTGQRRVRMAEVVSI